MKKTPHLSTQLLPLGQRLVAAHDACRVLIANYFMWEEDQIALGLAHIAWKYDLPRKQVDEIMARAKNCYSPPD